jgi:sugar-specific transcriptional regulator TrmB
MHKKQQDSLKGLDIRSNTKSVLGALAYLGRAKAVDIASYLNKPKSSIYDGLNELIDLGLAIEESSDTCKIFSIAQKEQLTQIKLNQLSLVENAFKEIHKIASSTAQKTTPRPRIRFYAGVEGTQQAFRDMQWNSEYKDAYLMWPMKDMLKTLGEQFLKSHGSERHKHKVVLHSIRKDSDRAFLKNHYEWLESDRLSQLREVRYAPKNADWNMSFWVYGEQTLFASSGSEHFAFIVRSQEFADLMTVLWKQTWERSRV